MLAYHCKNTRHDDHASARSNTMIRSKYFKIRSQEQIKSPKCYTKDVKITSVLRQNRWITNICQKYRVEWHEATRIHNYWRPLCLTWNHTNILWDHCDPNHCWVAREPISHTYGAYTHDYRCVTYNRDQHRTDAPWHRSQDRIYDRLHCNWEL